MKSYSIMALEREKEKIRDITRHVTFEHLGNARLISDYIFSEMALSDKYINEYKSGLIDFSTALSSLREQYRLINDANINYKMGRIKFYFIAERKREQNSTITIALKQVGFISGAMQVLGGAGICFASKNAACIKLGTPLIIQGLENTWENGYYLVYREDPKSMPVRSLYRNVANFMGGHDNDGDLAFAGVDLSLSFSTIFRSILKPDSWKLFRYIRQDYIVGWKDMGASGLIPELTGDSVVGFSIYQLMNNEPTDWNNLSEN